MEGDEYADEAIFDDLYDDEPAAAQTAASKVPILPTQQIKAETENRAATEPTAITSVSDPVLNETEYVPAEANNEQIDYSGYNQGEAIQGYNDYNDGQNYESMDSNGWGQDQQSSYYEQGGQHGGNMHGNGLGGDNSQNTAIKEDG